MKKLFLLTMLTVFALFANAQNHWPVNTHAFENSATLTCVVNLDGTVQTSNDLEVGAFCGDEIRGSQYPMSTFPIGNIKYFALTVWGNAGDAITFKIYDHGNEVEIPTNCYTTYTFEVNGSEGNPPAPYTINLHSVYAITASVNPAGAGTVTGTGNFEAGETCTLTATPANANYTFTNWTLNGNPVSTDATLAVTVSGNANYVAYFDEVLTITASVSPAGGGMVSINNGTPAATASGNFAAGDVVTLNATANSTYEFMMWTKNGNIVSEDEQIQITVTESAEYVAEFGQTLYFITAAPNPAAACQELTGMGQYAIGATATLGATAKPGYQFRDWSENGSVVSTANPYTFTVDDAHDFVANFDEQAVQCAVTAHCEPAEGGTISGTGSFWSGDQCTLTVTTNPGYVFQAWTDINDNIVSEDESFTFTVTGDVEYIATFSTDLYLITATAAPSYGGTVSGAGSFTYNQSCTLVATPATGYAFSNWTLNGSEVSTDASYTFTVTESGDYVANFIEQTVQYAVTAHCEPAEAGTISGTGSFWSGTQCTLTVTTNPGYVFQAWTDTNDNIVSEDESFTFTVTGDVEYIATFSTNIYIITATAAPSYGGTVSGAGSFTYNQSCTLVATPATGYDFVNWTLNGSEVSTDASYTFTVTESGDYVANFVAQAVQYAVTAHCEPAEAGTISGTGNYNAGDQCTLTVTTNPGYVFQAWTDTNDNIVSEDESFTFTVTGDVEYIATFSTNIYIISAAASPSYGGTVSGAGGYTYNQSCTLVATPADGYVFVNWTLNGSEVSTDASYTFTVTESGDYVANFASMPTTTYVVTVLVDPVDAGTVEGAGTFVEGATCTLTATPANAGSTFNFWTDENDNIISEDNPYTFTVNSDITVVAAFAISLYQITVAAAPSYGGTVTGGGSFAYGQSCTLSAVPAQNYEFLNWTLNGAVVSTNADYTFEVTEAGDYVANFTMESTYTITATTDPADVATIEGAGNYLMGQSCTLSISNITEGYTFVNWTLNGEEVSTDLSYTFNVTGDADYVANFVLTEFEIQINVTAEGGSVAVEGGINGTNMFHLGDICTLTATPDEGYYFVGWEENGVMVSEDNPYQFVVDGPHFFTPVFQLLNVYTITVVANPNAAGTVSGGGDYWDGSVITLSTTPNAGYTFINWTLNGQEVSTDESFSITVTENATYVANYVQDVFYVTVINNPANAGYVYGVIPGGYYLSGHTCVLQAIPYDGYTFAYWDQDGVQVSTSAYYTFDVYYNTVMTAHYTHDTYTISATADPVVGGTTNVSGTGNFSFGQSCTLTATANDGYTFVNWTKDDVEVATTTSYTFTVEESANYVAHFTQNVYNISVNTNPAGVAYVFIENGGNGEFVYGQSCTLRVGSINNGYNFVSWTKNGTVVSTDPTYTFTVTGNANFTANFDVDMFTITAMAVPSIGGTVSGAGEFAYGESCTLTATPRNGYTFLRWTKNGVPVSTNATYTFTVTANASFVAQFTTRAISIMATATEGGEVSGAGMYDYGETVVLTATAYDNYVFVGWTEAGGLVSTDAEYTFVAEKDRVLVANFRNLTGVDENSNFNVEVYPNPVVSNLTITTDMNDYQLEVYTITGSLVRTLNNCGNITTINVEELSKGAYIIRLTNGNVVETRRFVKE